MLGLVMGTMLAEKIKTVNANLCRQSLSERRGFGLCQQTRTCATTATSGRGSGVVGYNVQVAVDTEHYLIVAHEVTNSGSDRAQVITFGLQRTAGPYGKKRDI